MPTAKSQLPAMINFKSQRVRSGYTT